MIRGPVVVVLAVALLLCADVAHADPTLKVVAPDLRAGELSALRVVIGVPAGAWLVGDDRGSALSWSAGEQPAGIALGVAEIPTPSQRGDARVHEGSVTLSLPVTATASAPLGEHTVLTTLVWQLCTADGCAATLSQQLPLPVRVLPPLPPPRSKPLETR